MHTDSRGLPLTFESKTAADLCSTATESFVRRHVDTIPMLQHSLAVEPDNAFAQAVYGLMLHGARKSALREDIDLALNNAFKTADRVSAREQQYVDALSHAQQGNLFAMIRCYEAILQEHPTDLLALSLAQGELFWLGEMTYSLRLSEMVEAQWNDSIPGYPEYLGVLAFDLEEAGRFAEAEATGRESVERRASNAWGTQAVAHVLYMQGRHRDGIDWLSDKPQHWAQTNQIKFHIWWHQCLFHLEQGNHDLVLQHYDQWVRNPQQPLVKATPDLYIDLQNGASLLWRLEQQGVDVGHRWEEMAEHATGRIDDMSSPFTSAHCAVIFAAVARFDLCDALIEQMQLFTQIGDHTLPPRYHEAALPAAIAAVAHRRGDYRKVLDTLLPQRHSLWQMGGSHAQQDLFHQILTDAAVRLQQKNTVMRLLHEVEAIGFATPVHNVAYQRAGALASA